MKIDCYVTLGSERDTIYGTDKLIRDLDRAGVDMAVAVPADREIALNNRPGNMLVQKEVASENNIHGFFVRKFSEVCKFWNLIYPFLNDL